MDITSIEQLKEYNSEYHPKSDKLIDPVFIMDWWTTWIFTRTNYEDFKEGMNEMVKFTKDYEDGMTIHEARLRTIQNLRYCYGRMSIDSKKIRKNLNKLLIEYWGYGT